MEDLRHVKLEYPGCCDFEVGNGKKRMEDVPDLEDAVPAGHGAGSSAGTGAPAGTSIIRAAGVCEVAARGAGGWELSTGRAP